MGSHDMLTAAEFEEHLEGLSDRKLAEFTARQVFAMQHICEAHASRIATLELSERKGLGAATGFAAVMFTAIGGIVYGIVKALGK